MATRKKCAKYQVRSGTRKKNGGYERNLGQAHIGTLNAKKDIIEKGAFWQINQLSPGRCTITEKWRVAAGAISLNRGKFPLVDSTVDAAALMTLYGGAFFYLSCLAKITFVRES